MDDKAANGPLDWLTARPIAHRGLHDLNQACWENTATAFSRAVAGNFSIECDVMLAGDGVPVVFHDHELKRLTGTKGLVSDTASGDLTQLTIGKTADTIPLLSDMLALVDGRVPLIIELKGKKGHDDGLVEAVAAALGAYHGKAAIMSFDHHLVRKFPAEAPGIPAGLTAEGHDDAAMEAHFSMLAHGISFVSYEVAAIPNRFTAFMQQQMRCPLISWTVRDKPSAALTWSHGGQITFEGFNPDDE